ncbi:MAG: ribosome-associated translation inhibitor RaiA [Oscillospiraceae bacterium]|jgi:putative sigma-54 modulation protein|nr:ribosome-associated translation inhibitor RaiA [Oscillospiraceae bacterium]MBR6430808.1 ribosome-associated translation inhibitor RaiA [Oscillospiraceae bacterium]
MKLTFTEKKLQASDALRDYAERKIGKLDKFFKPDAEANVTFSVEHGRHVFELTVQSDGVFYRATESTSNMYASIDATVYQIERQIRKNKTRLEKHLRTGGIDFEPDGELPIDEEDLEEPEFKVVRNKHFPIKPMSVEEAILQMNLLNHEFYMFRDQNDGERIAVVYKRNKGGYGLIAEE